MTAASVAIVSNATTATVLSATATTTAAATIIRPAATIMTTVMDLITMSTASVSQYTAGIQIQAVSGTGSFINITTVPSPEPEAEPEWSYAEPEPDWNEAFATWGAAWQVHVYGIGCLFSILALFLLVSMVRLYRKRNLLSKGYFLSLTTLMFLMASTRAVYLLLDAYNAHQTFPQFVSYFLYTLSFPCITSAFSVLFLALLQTTRMQILSPRIQKAKFMAVIIGSHFTFSLLTDIIISHFTSAKVMLFLCQLIFVSWGFLIFIGYFYIFRRLYTAALKRQRGLEKLTSRRNFDKYGRLHPFHKPYQFTLSLAVKVVLVAAILGFISAVLELYAMFGVYGVFSAETPEPWPWWGFKFSFRLIELGLCLTMSYVATQPFRYRHHHHLEPNNDQSPENYSQSCSIWYFSPCQNVFGCSSPSDHQEASNLHWGDEKEDDDDLSSSLGSMEEERRVDTGCGDDGNCSTGIPASGSDQFIPEEMLPLNRYAVGDVHRPACTSFSSGGMAHTPPTPCGGVSATVPPALSSSDEVKTASLVETKNTVDAQVDADAKMKGDVQGEGISTPSNLLPPSSQSYHPSAISCMYNEEKSSREGQCAMELMKESKDDEKYDSEGNIRQSSKHGSPKPEGIDSGRKNSALAAEADDALTQPTNSNTPATEGQSPPRQSQLQQSQNSQSQLEQSQMLKTQLQSQLQSQLPYNKGARQLPPAPEPKFKAGCLVKWKINCSPPKNKGNTDNNKQRNLPEYPHDKSIDAQSRVLLGSQSQYGYSVLNNSPSPTQEMTQQNKTNSKNIKNSQTSAGTGKSTEKPKHRFSFSKLLFRNSCDAEFRKASKSSESSSKSDSDFNSGIIITPESSSSTDQNTLEEEVNGVRIAMDRLNSHLHCDV